MSVECSECGLRMLHDGTAYHDGQLVACDDGHVAMVSGDAESDPYVGDAEPASEWIGRLVNAFPDAGRKDDVRLLAQVVRALETRDTREVAESALAALTGEERRDIFASYCRGCGTPFLPCHCENDE